VTPNTPDIQRSFELKQIEFQAVLDLTISINKNQPESGLFLILENYLLEKLGINHFSIFTKDEDWHNTYSYGKSVQKTEHISGLQSQIQVSLLEEAHELLAGQNPHIHHVVPIFLSNQLRALILCSRLENYQYPYDAEGLALIQTLLSLTVMAQENQKLLAYRIRQEALRKEIEIARQVQQMLFPKDLPDTDHLKIYTTYLPHLDVSGDYYDYIPLGEDQFAICVADVSGKGMSAALLMSNFQACLRTLMMQKKGMEEVIETINHLICQNSNLERFITAFIAIYNAKTGDFTYVNSGHNPPCLIYENGKLESLYLGSPMLGIFPRLPHLNIGHLIITEPVLFAGYTDGLTEIEGPDGEEYGVERMETYLLENREEKLPVLHQRLLNRLEIFTGGKGFSDDITMLTARIRPK
jgi:sigma-B regulation protein RsbU (phosphoserine phosphatase)